VAARIADLLDRAATQALLSLDEPDFTTGALPALVAR
jgi:hypothetical protein